VVKLGGQSENEGLWAPLRRF